MDSLKSMGFDILGFISECCHYLLDHTLVDLGWPGRHRRRHTSASDRALPGPRQCCAFGIGWQILGANLGKHSKIVKDALRVICKR